MLFSVGFGN